MKLGDIKSIKKVIKRLEQFSYSDNNTSMWRLNLEGNIVKLTYLPEYKIIEFDLLQLIIENNIGGSSLSLVASGDGFSYIKLRVSSYTTVASLLSGLYLDYLIKKNKNNALCFILRRFLPRKPLDFPFILKAKEVEFKYEEGLVISDYDYTFVRADLATVDVKIEAFTLLILFDLIESDSSTV